MKANISISPAASLVHEDVEIVVDDLEYSTIHKLELRYLGVRFGGYFNCTPPVDLEYYLMYVKDSISQLEITHFSVTDPRERKVCEKMFRRRLMYPTVQRIEVEESFPPDAGARPKVTGTIFKPPGTGPFPTIIDISGTGGGLNEQKRAALDSRGFVVLCLAFFKYKSLPEDLLTVELQYFEDAINYITSLPYTRDRIVFQGVSFGGTLVMFLTTKFPKIKAVCSINGSFAMDQFAHVRVNGKCPPIGIFKADGAHVKFLNDLMVYTDMSALDDLSTPTIYANSYLSARLRDAGRKFEVNFVPGGHLLDPPCFPHHPMVYSNIAGLFQTYGGDTSLHGRSEFEVWERTVRFFSEHLGAPTPLPDYLRHSAKL
ncbi:Protein CBG14567 [Caenorhabditis briggsae]|uniref:Protein CBG14567 n=1 Tax=Caenorhabditis briggsae TaxID=6238 RepID=A8XK76_CAEBR|nr:Protein CBG14567 [Caenorhabditis briggsae]CAP33050.2 Protein CBG14567 [Caenorhabditis briggsae]